MLAVEYFGGIIDTIYNYSKSFDLCGYTHNGFKRRYNAWKNVGWVEEPISEPARHRDPTSTLNMAPSLLKLKTHSRLITLDVGLRYRLTQPTNFI